MEESEKELIRSRMSDLLLHTDCDTNLLTFLQQSNVLTIHDIEAIAAKDNGTSRVLEFYKIIQTRTNAFAVLLEGLKRYKQFGALQILSQTEYDKEELPNVNVKKRVKTLFKDELVKKNLQFDTSPPVHLFTGRRKELDELHEMVMQSKEGKTVTVISQLTTVTGLGGIGKTQLARQYITEQSFEFDENIVWLNAESPESLGNSFRRLATEKLGLSTKDANGKDKSSKAIAEDVYKWFEGSRALFIFDNAEGGKSWLQSILPNPNRNPDLYSVITSRETEWGSGMKIISLDVFSKDEAMSMVKLGLGIRDKSQDENISKLSETVQRYPLALYQAISYIYEQSVTGPYSISDYVLEFESTKEELMLSYRDVDYLDDTYMLTTATTWKITVEKIKADPVLGSLAIQIFHTMAYLHPDAIQQDFFFHPQLYPDESISSDEEKVKHAVRLLVKYSMINGEERQSRLSIHRLVQAVTRNQLSKAGKVEDILQTVMELLSNDDEKWKFPMNNVDHGLRAWHFGLNHETIVENNCHRLVSLIEKTALIGRLEEGSGLCNETLANFESQLGPNNFSLAYFFVQGQLANIFIKQSKLDDSIAIVEVALENFKVCFEETSDIFMILQEILATALMEKGKMEEGNRIFQTVYDNKRALLGEDDFDTLAAQTSLGMSLFQQGKFTEAQNIFQIVSEKTKKIPDDTDENLALKLELYIALCHGFNTNFESTYGVGRSLYFKLLPNWYENVFIFAIVSAFFGIELILNKRPREALDILEANYKRISKILGENNNVCLMMLNAISDANAVLNNPSEALRVQAKAVQGFARLLGEDSFRTLGANLKLLSKHSNEDYDKEANETFKQVLCKMESDLGEANMEVLSHKLAYASKAIKEDSKVDLEYALEIFCKTKPAVIENFGEDHEMTKLFSTTIHQIQNRIRFSLEYAELVKAKGLLKNKKTEEAENILRWLYNSISLRWDEDTSLFTEICCSLGNALHALGRSHEARKILCDNFTRVERVLGGTNNKMFELFKLITQATDSNTAMILFDKEFNSNELKIIQVLQNADEKLSSYFTSSEETNSEMLNLDKHLKRMEFVGTLNTYEFITKAIFSYATDPQQDPSQKIFEELNDAQDVITTGFPNVLECLPVTQYSEIIDAGKNKLRFFEEYSQFYKALEFEKAMNGKEALKLYKNIYEKLQPIWKEDVVLFASSCRGVMGCLILLRRFSEAFKIYNDNFEKVQQFLGKQHILTNLLLLNLGVLEFQMLKVKEALEIFTSVEQTLLELPHSAQNLLFITIAKQEMFLSLICLREHSLAFNKFEEIVQIAKLHLGFNEMVIQTIANITQLVEQHPLLFKGTSGLLDKMVKELRGLSISEQEFQKVSEMVRKTKKKSWTCCTIS